MGVHTNDGDNVGGGMIGFNDRGYIDAEIKKSITKAKAYTDNKVGSGSGSGPLLNEAIKGD